MLAISNKLSEHVDIAKPLAEYCEAAYGPESGAIIKNFCSQLEELRQDAIMSYSNTVEAQRNALRRYLGALEVLEEKFPIGQPLSVVTKVPFPPVKFVWSDSFRPRSKVKGTSVRFERACVLFNFGANQSLMARDTDRSTPEGQKNAVALYQNAAGVFILLRDQVLPQCVAAGEAMGMDLSDTAVSMCASLMLAQAQALFYEKAVKDKSSRGLLAKLANQTSNFYATAAQMAYGLKDHIDSSWGGHCKFQESLFLAAAHFQQAMADKPNVQAKLSGFGQLVARLRAARDIANSVDQIPNISAAVAASIGPLREAIRAELTAVEFDNTNVYIEVVPALSALAPIGLVPAVKPTTISLGELKDMTYVEGYISDLDKLAPVEVKRKAEWIENETGRVANKLASVVGNLKVKTIPLPLQPGVLPVPLDGKGHVDPISDEIWQKIARIQVLGGPIALDGQLATLHGLTGDCDGLVSFINRTLDEEERVDKNCRDRFGLKFSRTASQELNQSFRNQVANYKQKLALAIETNRKVRDRIGSQDRNLIGLLTKSRAELDAIWVEKNSTPIMAGPVSVNPVTEQLKEECRFKLGAAEALLAEASKKTAEFTANYGPNSARIVEMMKSGDIEKFAANVVSNAEKDCQTICQDIMARFSVASAEVDAAFNALLQHLGGDSSPRQSKGNWLQALDMCATIIAQGFSDVGEGVSFFNKLGDYLRKLKTQVDDFAFARNEEKNGILQNIQRGLTAANTENASMFGNSPQIPNNHYQ
jgi:programmed cell death 6-interacting protein